MSEARSVIISPSLLSADFANLAVAANDALQAGAEALHFDVMDGMFVPNITFGAPILKALRPHSTALFDVHLMIVDPDRYIPDFVKAGADIITVQAEACTHLQRTLSHIRSLGARAGVALNPATSPGVLEYVMADVDLILAMTVNPGFGGQAYIPAVEPKIARLREMIAAQPHEVLLEVDGAISAVTAPRVCSLGATALVAGTAIYGHVGGVAAGIAELRAAAAS